MRFVFKIFISDARIKKITGQNIRRVLKIGWTKNLILILHPKNNTIRLYDIKTGKVWYDFKKWKQTVMTTLGLSTE